MSVTKSTALTLEQGRLPLRDIAIEISDLILSSEALQPHLQSSLPPAPSSNRPPSLSHLNNSAEKSKSDLVRKIDLRLCTIAGILCSLNLLDSGIISSASVTSIFKDLGLGQGNRYSVAILVYTVASVTFQLPATILVRVIGPRWMFAGIVVGFGLVTLVS